MSIIAIIIICVLTLFLGFSCFFMIKFALLLLKVEDALEESIDILEKRQDSISNILEIPLFYDSNEVRQVHSDIEDCKESIISVAEVLSKNVSSNNFGETDLEEKEKN
tara:strand:+ start:2066 stop:2389 length:324 start_codon:yes stop_codon:yes gene_type:complete